jgi:hypothetical protein
MPAKTSWLRLHNAQDPESESAITGDPHRPKIQGPVSSNVKYFEISSGSVEGYNVSKMLFDTALPSTKSKVLHNNLFFLYK